MGHTLSEVFTDEDVVRVAGKLNSTQKTDIKNWISKISDGGDESAKRAFRKAMCGSQREEKKLNTIRKWFNPSGAKK
jgi:hypothetical protein